MTEKEEFIELLRKIDRDPQGVEDLIKYLESSDFFTAPASTKYHSCYPGGLCHHKLMVYKRLKNLADVFYPAIKPTPHFEESLIILALGHDFGKINFYKETSNSRKEYSDNGRLSDALGKFDWVSEKGYKVRDAKDRYLYGTHGQNSERILSKFIPLTDEESAAIVWHMGSMDGITCEDLSDIYNKYPLAVLLHAADYLATYMDERI